jgi:hypothetical protein
MSHAELFPPTARGAPRGPARDPRGGSARAVLAIACAAAGCGIAMDPPHDGALPRADAGVYARDASTPPPPPVDAVTPSDTTERDARIPAADVPPARDSAASGVWRPFADDSPWNTRIPTTPEIDPESTAIVNDLATSSMWNYLSVNITGYSIPVYYVDATTPRVMVTAEDVVGEGFDMPVPIPSGAAPDPQSDHHLCIVDRAAGLEWGMWNTRNTGGAWRCGVGARANLRGSGARPLADVASPWQLAHGARACGFPLIAGLIRVEEIRAGRIDHALVIAYPHIRSRYYTPPASTSQAGIGSNAIPTRGAPCGARIQLDPSVDVAGLGLSAAGRVIARALQEYGAYVGDYSGAISLYAENQPDARAAWSGVLGELDLQTRVDLHRLRVLRIGTLHDGHN